MKHRVEPVKIQIRQQRGNNSPLRSSFAAAPNNIPTTPTPLTFHLLNDRRLKPHTNQLQHRPIRHTHPQARQKPLMGNRIKVALKIRVVHRLIPSLQVAAYLFKRLVRISVGAKPIGTVLKVRLKDRLQDQQTRRLHYPVGYRRDSQWPLSPVRFINVDAPYRLGLIALGAKLLMKSANQALGSAGGFLDCLDTDAVKPGCSTIRSHFLPGRPKHIAPIDPVIQCIKPKLRLRLGLLTKLMSQKRKFPQSHTINLTLGKLQLSRSGIFIQAAFPLSSVSLSSLRPLRSTVITRFFATTGLSDSRQGPAKSYLFPLTVIAPAGLPGSSADLFTRAALSHPEESDDCSRPLLHRRFQASSSLADWPLLFSVTRPKQVRLRCGSRVRLAGLRQWNYSHSRLLSYLSNGQSTRYPPFRILDRPGFILALQRRKARQEKKRFRTLRSWRLCGKNVLKTVLLKM